MDLISRQAAIKAADSIIERDTSGNNDVVKAMTAWQEYIKALPSAQPVVISKSENATECEDAVSREAVLNEIHRYMEERDYTIGLLDDNVCGLPPVTPKQPGWTYIEEALPKTIINEHTHDYQEYNCLCDFGDNGFDVRTYKFGNGHFWNGGGIVDKYVTAWQPLPKIPDELKPKPWGVEQDERSD